MLGLTKVSDNCGKIQRYGEKKDETGIMDERCVSRIKVALAAIKEEYTEAEQVLKRFFAR